MRRQSTIPLDHRERINEHLRAYRCLLQALARCLNAPQEISPQTALAEIDASLASFRGIWRASVELRANRLPTEDALSWREAMSKALDHLSEGQRTFLVALLAPAGGAPEQGAP